MAEFTKERIIEELKASTQNANGMFEISEDTICNLMSMLTNAAPQLPQPAVLDEWRMMCGEWRDETVSIHDTSGLIVSGISPEAAGIIIEAHNACRAATLNGDKS